MTEEAEAVSDLAEKLQLQLAHTRSRLVQSELKSHAIRAGIIDIDCLKLLDTSTLKTDDDGNLVDAALVLDTLRRDKPWFFAKPSSSYPAAPPLPEPPKQRKATEMTHKEWQAARSQLLKQR